MQTSAMETGKMPGIIAEGKGAAHPGTSSGMGRWSEQVGGGGSGEAPGEGEEGEGKKVAARGRRNLQGRGFGG